MDHDTTAQVLPLQFTGKASEYFRIWIVNVLLTILTLGIYSAWAKVRRRRYFYGNTLLNDAPFDYLANPVAILKGWLIAAAAAVTYMTVSHFYPISGPFFALLLFLAVPWLIVRGMVFNARNTAHRNIRFTYEKNYGDAVKAFVGLALLTPLTLGLSFPYMIYRQAKFLVENGGFGNASFAMEASPSDYYKVYAKASGLIIVCVLGLAAIAFVGFKNFDPQAFSLQEQSQGTVRLLGLLPLFITVSIYVVVFAYITTATSNLKWNSTTIAGNRFQSTLRMRDVLWLYVTNALGIIVSLGLLVPWAHIRMARYRAENLALLANGSMDEFLAVEQGPINATGEELGEVFGVDFGF